MKDKFSWYYPLSKSEFKDIWDKAMLTLDANVLLDLYRYHENTRNALIDALKKFEGRIWISYQTAEEFFRNRKKVIVSSINSYDDATQQLSNIRANVEDPLNRLKSNRIIPDSIAETIRNTIARAVKNAQEQISKAKEEHPNFLEEDPILETISALFKGAVGDAFSKEQRDEASKEAKRRMDGKIPPGFLDAKKDGYRPYGDFFMWRQILDHAADKKRPVIFVTSEGKEDWWEKASGKTTGLHYELLKEAFEATGQRFLAYRTDRFFTLSAELSGEESNESAAREISALVKERAASTALLRLVSQIESKATHETNNGTLVIELLRPAYMFTCTGHFEPNLRDVPGMQVHLVDHPTDIPRHIVRSGTGTTFDFNVHVKSISYGEYLPVGEYVFKYSAEVEGQPDETDGE